MTSPLRRVSTALVVAAFALTATACASTPEPQASATTPAPVASSPTPTAEPEEPTAPAADPTCETIIAEDVVADFESIGWTVMADTFRIGEIELTDGIQCMWGDFTTVSDHVQIFGWAEISADDAETAQDALLDEGWILEEGTEGIYITESPDTAVATDEDGYGITYLFGDGWVKIADTKQGLILIEWPPA
jgi:hypothetical protein